jgi:hypothetical protein
LETALCALLRTLTHKVSLFGDGVNLAPPESLRFHACTVSQPCTTAPFG